MTQVSSLRLIHGLDVNSNPLTTDYFRDKAGTKSPLVIADNAVIGRQYMVGNRTGFDYFTQGTSSLVTSMFEFQNYLVQHQNGDNLLWYCTATNGTRTQYTGTYVAPSVGKIDSAVARGSLFLTTNNGPYKLDTVTGTPIRSGICRGLDVRIATTGTGGGFLGGNSRVAYHVTWVRTDNNNQQVRSDVSSRILLNNLTRVTISTLTSSAGTATATTATAHGFSTGQLIFITGATQTQYNGSFTITSTGGTTFTYTVSGSPATPATTTTTITAELQLNASLTFIVPWDVKTNDKFEVWRTIQVDASNPDPGDNCFLISSIVNSTAAGGTITYVDSTADTILVNNTPLYTNANQQGAQLGNARPPLCQCIATYKDYGIYGNTAIDHSVTINMLGTSSFVSGTSSITITNANATSRTYICGTSENAATQTWQLYTGGSSPSLNVRNSSQSLVHVINADTSGFWYAEYTSDANPNNNPGLINLFARLPSSGSFTITANNSTTGNQFTPVIPASGTTVMSSNDARPNRLFFSKFQQPDATPLLQTIDVGRLDQPIRRLISVRDACFIIKDDGIFYIDGLEAPFALHELDTTCRVLAPWSATPVNNQIYMLSNQGIVQVSISGVTVISLNIEPLVNALLPLNNISTVAFGVGNESQRQYILWVPTLVSDSYATQAFVFHTFYQEWTRWTKPASAGLAMNTNLTLYIAAGIENAVLQQRNTGTFADYSDESQSINVLTQSGANLTITWPSTVYAPVVGMTIAQNAIVAKTIAVTLVSGTTYTVTLDSTVAFSPGRFTTARTPIFFHARLAPNICGDSGITKQFYNVEITLENESVTQAQIELGTNEGSQFYTYSITRNLVLGWGQNLWGAVAWGDPVSPSASTPFAVDFPVPDNTGESAVIGFLHSVSEEPFNIAQIDLFYDNLSEYEVVD